MVSRERASALGLKRLSEIASSIPIGANDEPRARLVLPEQEFRRRPEGLNGRDARVAGVTLSRWSNPSLCDPIEAVATHDEDAHVITLSLRHTSADFTTGNQYISKGGVLSRSILITSPTTQPRQAIYRDAFDFFRIYLSQNLISECFEAAYGRPPSSELVLFNPQFVQDQAMERLARLLVNVDEYGGPLGPVFVETIGLALASRLVGLEDDKRAPANSRNSCALAGWRLKRVVDYIEANVTQRLSLGDLSDIAGYSRMHFAAQFRAATGLAPHAYVLQRKIARAQQLMLDRMLSIVDVALITGFSSQAHFTNVFKKVVGVTPKRWLDEAK